MTNTNIDCLEALDRLSEHFANQPGVADFLASQRVIILDERADSARLEATLEGAAKICKLLADREIASAASRELARFAARLVDVNALPAGRARDLGRAVLTRAIDDFDATNVGLLHRPASRPE